MNATPEERQWAQKTQLRRLALRRRAAQPDKPALSERICATVKTLPEYRQARTICSYVGVGTEVLTRDLLGEAMAVGKQVTVPYVHDKRLALFHLHDLAELAPAPFDLLEPRVEMRDQPARRIQPRAVDLFVVPGLAFDASGARLGHGQRYYDNLLRRARAETPRVGLAFACQVLPRLPVLEYDVSMHAVVTEGAVYRPHASDKHLTL